MERRRSLGSSPLRLAGLTHSPLPLCVLRCLRREGGIEHAARATSCNPLSAPSLHAELQLPFTIGRYLHLEGGRSVVKGNSGFVCSSMGIQNFIICSLPSSRHPFVGSIFPALCIFHKTKHFPFHIEAPGDLRAVYCLSG